MIGVERYISKESNQERKQLTRWLEPSFDVGGELCYALLMAKAQVIIRSSVSPLNKGEINSEDIRAMKNECTQELNKRLTDKENNVVLEETPDTLNYDKYSIVNDTILYIVPYEDDESDFNTVQSDEEDEEIQFDKHMMR